MEPMKSGLGQLYELEHGFSPVMRGAPARRPAPVSLGKSLWRPVRVFP